MSTLNTDARGGKTTRCRPRMLLHCHLRFCPPEVVSSYTLAASGCSKKQSRDPTSFDLGYLKLNIVHLYRVNSLLYAICLFLRSSQGPLFHIYALFLIPLCYELDVWMSNAQNIERRRKESKHNFCGSQAEAFSCSAGPLVPHASQPL